MLNSNLIKSIGKDMARSDRDSNSGSKKEVNVASVVVLQRGEDPIPPRKRK
jgi:hypothetical protein